jgi:predicted permease
MVKILADALVPIFAGLLLGYIAGLRGVLDNQNVRNLIVFVMSFAVPCSMFLSIAQTPRATLGEQTGAALVLAIVYFVLFAVTFFGLVPAKNCPLRIAPYLRSLSAFQTQRRWGCPCLLPSMAPNLSTL